MTPTDIEVEREGPLAWLRVNRPQVRNALSFDFAGRLTRAVQDLGDDPEIRVVVLTGAGDRAFISGADITEFKERLTTAAGAIAYDERLEELAVAIERLSKPVIALIQGSAVGSGLLVALACDVRIAVDEAKFGIPIAKLGLVPSVPDLRRLVTFAGLSNAKRMLMTGEIISAADALSRGLLDQVVPRAAATDTVRELASVIATRAPVSIAVVKRMLSTEAGAGTSVRDGEAFYAEVYGSEDLDEGIAAFFEKRQPVFKGR